MGPVFIDEIQTAAIVFAALAQIYAIFLLRKELRGAAGLLQEIAKTQSQLHENVRRVWERVDALETRQGVKGDVDTFIRMKRLMEALEHPRPRGAPQSSN